MLRHSHQVGDIVCQKSLRDWPMGFLKSPLCLFGSHPKDKGRLLTRVDLCHYVKWLSLRLRWPQLPAVRSNLWWLYCTVCAACYISTRPHWLQAKLFCLLLDVIESILGAGVGGVVVVSAIYVRLCVFVCERERGALLIVFCCCFFLPEDIVEYVSLWGCWWGCWWGRASLY